MKTTLLAIPLVLTGSGCCAIAELFCGPDRSRWVSESFDSARETLDTFVEACRRDDSGAAFRCTSQAFRDRNRAGQFEWAILWERLKEQVPIHLLGNATVENPTDETPDRVRYVLTRLGHRVQVTLVRQLYQEIAWYEDGEVTVGGGVVRTLRGRAKVQLDDDGIARAEARVISETSVDDLRLRDIHRIAVGREWKIDDIRPVTDS